MPNLVPGSSAKLNRITGIGAALVTTYAEAAALRYVMGRGNFVYLSDTKELKVGDDTSPIGALPDHRHPFTYSPLGHTHMHGTNEPWLMSNPRLWYAEDVENHPELVVLDGRDISDDQAEYLSTVYPGVKLLTDAITTVTGNNFENDNLTLTTDGWTGGSTPSKLFGDELSIDNIYQVMDQWLASSGALTEHTLTIHFKNGYTYRPTHYWVCPAAGTSDAIATQRPTPKTWYFEVSDDGETWTALDTHTNVSADAWPVFTTQFFEVTTNDSYSYFRLRIAEWNEGAITGLEPGLRRFWVFGRKLNGFALPKLESPNPNFVWVVPKQNIGVALKHEDVGDLGVCALTEDNLPAYRLLTDGSAKSKATYDLLYSAIGNQFAPEAQYTASVSDGSVVNNAWSTGITDASRAAYLTMTLSAGAMLGGYSWDAEDVATSRVPLTWIIEGSTDGTNWTTLQNVTCVDAAEFRGMEKFFLDTNVTDAAYTQYRLNVTSWSAGSEAITLALPKIYTHPVGQFYLPNVSSEDGTAYIVSQVNATDVSTDIIQRLQQNIISLTSTIAQLQNQVNRLDPEFESVPEESSDPEEG